MKHVDLVEVARSLRAVKALAALDALRLRTIVGFFVEGGIVTHEGGLAAPNGCVHEGVNKEEKKPRGDKPAGST